MTHKKALEMRNLLNYLFTLGKTQYHYVAIRKCYENDPKSEWEVCLYGGTKHSSFLIELGTLATALVSIIPDIVTYAGTYNAGTTSTDYRMCFIIK